MAVRKAAMSAEKASPTAKASNLSTGKAWIWAVMASLKGRIGSVSR